jgi:glycosyltransferase involved in cell wall biosynthesis
MAGLKVLFVADTSSDDDCSAVRRLLVLKEGLENLGVQTGILYLGNYFLRTPKLLLPINIPRFLKLIQNYEIIHAPAGVSAYVMGIAKYLCNFTLVCDVHGSFEESRILKRSTYDLPGYYYIVLSMITQPITLKRSDFFIACSQWLEKDLVKRGLEKKRVVTIRNGVDTELFKPSNQKLATHTFTITYAGAFQKWQGIDNFLEAAQILKNTDIRFKIIGFKNRDFALKEKIGRSLGNKVELVNFMSQRELVHHLQNSDVLIIPRDRNLATVPAFPTKFAEYVAIGKPVIVTAVDETADLVRKYNCGFVCEPTPRAIADAIASAKQTDPRTLLEMGLNGRRLAETELDQNVIGKQYFQLLLKIAESSSRK